MPSIDTSEVQVVLTESPALKIPTVLSCKKVRKIRIPKNDIYISFDLEKLLVNISEETLEEIKNTWENRNLIDVERKCKNPVLELTSENLAETIRWHLRGMPVDLAVWKVRSYIINFLYLQAAEEARNIILNIEFNGFKIRTRVVLSNESYARKNMIGWEGVVVKVKEDYCLVQFDLDPKEIDGGDKKWQFTYDNLSILRPYPPKIKEKKELKSFPKPKLRIKSENDSPNTEEVNVENKVKHILPIVKRTEITEPLKAKNSPQSQDKSKYTAIELAEKLNVSRAKIYQMRSSGTLETAGYRAESNGRSLLFVSID
jgi:hypothetical protein